MRACTASSRSPPRRRGRPRRSAPARPGRQPPRPGRPRTWSSASRPPAIRASTRDGLEPERARQLGGLGPARSGPDVPAPTNTSRPDAAPVRGDQVGGRGDAGRSARAPRAARAPRRPAGARPPRRWAARPAAGRSSVTRLPERVRPAAPQPRQGGRARSPAYGSGARRRPARSASPRPRPLILPASQRSRAVGAARGAAAGSRITSTSERPVRSGSGLHQGRLPGRQSSPAHEPAKATTAAPRGHPARGPGLQDQGSYEIRQGPANLEAASRGPVDHEPVDRRRRDRRDARGSPYALPRRPAGTPTADHHAARARRPAGSHRRGRRAPRRPTRWRQRPR